MSIRAQLEEGARALAAGEAAFLEALDGAHGDPARIEEATETFERLQEELRAQGRSIVEEAQARMAASSGPSSGTSNTPSAPAEGAAPGTQSPGATPTPVGLATVRPGTTVWEISMRTGVPVERILEFNAQGGNPLDPNRLEVGQQIYVPLGEGDVQDRPKTAAEVQMMRDEANGVNYFENLRFRSPAEVEGDFARAASLDGPAPPAGPPRPVEEPSVLDLVWRDFDWRSVGNTAFNAAADIGDSVGALAQGFGSGVADMATGAVLGAAELANLNAKLSYGTPRERLEALQALWGMGGALVDHTVESGRYLVHGVTNPGDVLDAMAQLGIKGSAEQLGRATASAEGTVTSLYGMAGPVRSLGRRILSGTDETAEAAGRTSAGAAGETIPARSVEGVKVGDFSSELSVDSIASRRHLRRALGPGSGQGHHLVPWELRNHELVQRAAKGGFNLNGAENGMRLGPGQHLGSHPKYNAAVQSALTRILQSNPGLSNAQYARLLRQHLDTLRAGLAKSNGKLR